MEVTIYADMLFALSFCCNVTIFYVLKKIFLCGGKVSGTIAGALFGALIDVVWAPFYFKTDKSFVFYVPFIFMIPVIRFVFKGLSLKKVFSVWVSYVFIAALISGIYEMLFSGTVKVLWLILLFPSATIFAVSILCDYKKYRARQPFIYNLRIKQGDAVLSTMGFYDTGNTLVEPLSGSMVIIVDKMVYKRLIEVTDPDNMCFVPYTSVGTAEGYMEAVKIDAVCIIDKEAVKVFEKVVAAKSVNSVSPDGYYSAILHQQMMI